MRIGVIFPQNEIGSDPGIVRDYAQTAENRGYTHLLAYDHVLGADPRHRPGWTGYTHASLFHEVFVLFGYLAGVTTQLELVTGVLILPQRQTALVAKQAAEIDILSRGRMRLGVGVGWNKVEYDVLGENFGDRGKRIEEQVDVLRALWTQEVVTLDGRWHHIVEAGINPLPVQRPIPIWMGGGAEEVLRRIARVADGWFPQLPPTDEASRMIERLRTYATAAGRDPAAIGIEARLSIGTLPPEEWVRQAKAWRTLGATHLTVNTMGAGLPSPSAHIEMICRVKETLDSALG